MHQNLIVAISQIVWRKGLMRALALSSYESFTPMEWDVKGIASGGANDTCYNVTDSGFQQGSAFLDLF